RADVSHLCLRTNRSAKERCRVPLWHHQISRSAPAPTAELFDLWAIEFVGWPIRLPRRPCLLAIAASRAGSSYSTRPLVTGGMASRPPAIAKWPATLAAVANDSNGAEHRSPREFRIRRKLLRRVAPAARRNVARRQYRRGELGVPDYPRRLTQAAI